VETHHHYSRRERINLDIGLLSDKEKRHATTARYARIPTPTVAQLSGICDEKQRRVETGEPRVGWQARKNLGSPQAPSGIAHEGNAVSQQARECA
jgi:hypothetical protein